VRAVVLVGGEGTRLRPLTETIPKPLVPLVDRPALDHVLDHLSRHGVDEVVLSSSYLELTFHDFLRRRAGDPRVIWVTERQPLGTGGAVIGALDRLGDEPFLALNGDILTDLDVSAMAAFHRERGAEVTIALHHVDDARPYGLVPTEADGRVLEFREKPAELVPGDVNAGTYVLHPAALRRWRAGTNLSIERDVFPALIADSRPVFGFLADAYWIDLGTPESYLRAQADLLDGRVRDAPVVAAPFVSAGAWIDPAARLGRHVVVGAGGRVEAGAIVEESALLDGVRVERGAVVRRTILGPRAVVGAGAVVEDGVLAEAVEVKAGAAVRGGRASAGELVG
jgi:mannose-1-phosphate guanylyltransferase